MKEIVSLKKILNNETVLQIHVCIMPWIGVDADNFDDHSTRDDRLEQQKNRRRETANGALYEPQL
jgi:hypothetical protein